MLTVFIRLALTLASSMDDATLQRLSDACVDVALPDGSTNCETPEHALAHRACEAVVYAALTPGVADDATTPVVEAVAEILCRD